MTKGDKILIGGLIVSALLFLIIGKFGAKNNFANQVAVIRARGIVVERIDLNSHKNKEVQVPGTLGYSIIQVADGQLRMVSSPCPDKICVKQGEISQGGQSIVCVPNEVSISIEKKGELDEITK